MRSSTSQANNSVVPRQVSSIQDVFSPQFIHYGRVVTLPDRLNQVAFERIHKTKNLLPDAGKIIWFSHQNLEMCLRLKSFQNGYSYVCVQKYRGISLSQYYFLNCANKKHNPVKAEVLMHKLISGVAKAVRYLHYKGVNNAYVIRRRVILTDLGVVRLVGWYEQFQTTEQYCNKNPLTYIFQSLLHIYENFYSGSIMPLQVQRFKQLVTQPANQPNYLGGILEFAKERENTLKSEIDIFQKQILKEINDLLVKHQKDLECKVVQQYMT